MPGIIAPRTFHPGDVIYREEPFLELLCIEFKDKACGFCYKRSETLKPCKHCSEVKYCGKPCQKKDWDNHRLECKHLKNLPTETSINMDHIRLIGNFILKTKGKDWKTIKSRILGTDISFDDIDTGLEESMRNPRLNLFHEQCKDLVRRYIGDENMPEDDALKKIFGKMINNINFCSMESGTKTVSFIIGLCGIDQECIPNCNVSTLKKMGPEHHGPRTLWAIREIKKSEKISATMKHILDSPVLTNSSYESCNCTDCSLPYGESVLSKIIDRKRASSIIAKSERFLDMWYSFSVVRSLPIMKQYVDIILKRQAGVLGETNALHLKILAIKCFHIGGDPLEMKRDLMKLEKNMVAVFGEYFPRNIGIYESLAEINFLFGDSIDGLIYTKKAEVIKEFVTQ